MWHRHPARDPGTAWRDENHEPDYPPTLLLHGDADTDVPHARSADMAAALERAGVPHEFITIPGGPHGFEGKVTEEDFNSASPSPGARALRRAAEFLGEHLGVLQ